MSKTLTEQYKGNVPVGMKYKLIDVYYKPKSDDINLTPCDNCGILISNIYTIQDETGKKYDVGSECVEAILGHSLELIEAKRLLAKKIRFIKALKQATSITIHPHTTIPGHYFRFYFGSMIREKWDVNARGWGEYETYKDIIDKLNIPKTVCQE